MEVSRVLRTQTWGIGVPGVLRSVGGSSGMPSVLEVGVQMGGQVLGCWDVGGARGSGVLMSRGS